MVLRREKHMATNVRAGRKRRVVRFIAAEGHYLRQGERTRDLYLADLWSS